ncbi:MAG: glycosyltransferase [Flavobacteriales bacterium AspAUS03]
MRKTILFILPNLRAGGAEKVTTLLANYLDRKKFIPKLLLFQKEGIYLNILKNDIEIIEISVSRIRYSLFKILKTIKKLQPDIVFSGFGELNAFISPCLPFFKRIKFIARETNVVSQHVKQKRTLFFYRFYNNFDKIIAQSDDMKEDLIKNLRIRPEKIVKINNPIDMDFIQGKLKERGRPKEYFTEKKNFLSVGSLNHRKGFDFLLRVFSHLRNLPVHLFIIGEGPEEKKLLKMTQKLSLQNVSFLGIRANPFLYMKYADLFILSSRYEGFPNVLLEANACGTPVVANHCKGGIDEIIQLGVNGEYGPIEDEKAFSNLILKTLNRKDTYHNLSQIIREKYHVTRIVSSYAQVFESILQYQ